jgi:hypothetical protein
MRTTAAQKLIYSYEISQDGSESAHLRSFWAPKIHSSPARLQQRRLAWERGCYRIHPPDAMHLASRDGLSVPHCAVILGSGPTHDDFRTTHVGLPNQTASCKPSARPNRIYANFVAENAPPHLSSRPDASDCVCLRHQRWKILRLRKRRSIGFRPNRKTGPHPVEKPK